MQREKHTVRERSMKSPASACIAQVLCVDLELIVEPFSSNVTSKIIKPQLVHTFIQQSS